jgi:hypothetical protein
MSSKARGLADLGNAFDDGALSNRNLIINGAMKVAQRGTSTTGVTSGVTYVADRMPFSLSSLGTWTLTQESDGPDGFANSVKMDCTNADASPAAADYVFFFHRIEGQDLQQLGYGTSGAQSMVLSFYVKSNKTGNGTVGFFQTDNSFKHQSHQYTINAANTWERKSIIIPSDTSGVINDDNGRGFEIEWALNSGSNFSAGTLQSTWTALNNTNRNPSNLGIGGSTSDYWQITGIQLEVGDTATPFEHRSYGDELAKCQRYYEKSFPQGTAPAGGLTPLIDRRTAVAYGTTYFGLVENFMTPKRATPTVVLYRDSNAGTSNSGTINWYSGSSWSEQAVYSTTAQETGFKADVGPGGLTSGRAYLAGYQFTAEAEL